MLDVLTHFKLNQSAQPVVADFERFPESDTEEEPAEAPDLNRTKTKKKVKFEDD